MAKNLVSGLILAPLVKIWAPKYFWWVLALLVVRHCCKLSFCAISKKTNEPNLRKWKIKVVSGLILAQIRTAKFFFFFFLNLASSVTKSEKTNDPMSRKPSDGQMDRLTRVISLDTVRLTVERPTKQ